MDPLTSHAIEPGIVAEHDTYTTHSHTRWPWPALP